MQFIFIDRFKDHVQSNNPKHFLSEEEFVQLRLELSKANLATMVSEDEDKPAVEEELPPGIEDLADPAKVQFQVPLMLREHDYCLLDLAGGFLFSMVKGKEIFV